mmetsp:Transcript_23555/g.79531  ORF Transcript_23555/g.79531 Transcript_23555/m.79531 type:complete len:201 (+) Transcript_23555:748-1350(+)
MHVVVLCRRHRRLAGVVRRGPRAAEARPPLVVDDGVAAVLHGQSRQSGMASAGVDVHGQMVRAAKVENRAGEVFLQRRRLQREALRLEAVFAVQARRLHGVFRLDEVPQVPRRRLQRPVEQIFADDAEGVDVGIGNDVGHQLLELPLPFSQIEVGVVLARLRLFNLLRARTGPRVPDDGRRRLVVRDGAEEAREDVAHGH